MMDQTAKFSPQGLVTDFVGEAQINNEATKQVLNGLPQLVFISEQLHNEAGIFNLNPMKLVSLNPSLQKTVTEVRTSHIHMYMYIAPVFNTLHVAIALPLRNSECSQLSTDMIQHTCTSTVCLCYNVLDLRL